MHASPRSRPTRRHLLVLGGWLFGLVARGATPGSGERRLHDCAGHSHALATLDTDVDYRVNGLVAEVQVRQQFRNIGKEWLEGDGGFNRWMQHTRRCLSSRSVADAPTDTNLLLGYTEVVDVGSLAWWMQRTPR